MAKEKLWIRVAKALSSTLALEDIAALKTEVAERLGEVEMRLREVDVDGQQRRRVLEEGSPDDLVALDRELAALKAEETQLRHRSSLLNNNMHQAKANLAIRNVGKYNTDLRKAVAAAKMARESFDQAIAEAERAANVISSAQLAAKRISHIKTREIVFDDEAICKLAELKFPADFQGQANYLNGRSQKGFKAAVAKRRQTNPGAWRQPRSGGVI